MTRTFSKIHGLAALRIGWAYCPAGDRRRAEPHPRAVQRLLAGDRRRHRRDRGRRPRRGRGPPQRDWLPWLAQELGRLGLTVTPSVANFLLVHFPADRGRGAAAADEFLKSRGIILRRVGVYGLPGALRLTVGTEAENRAVVGALAEFLEKAIP